MGVMKQPQLEQISTQLQELEQQRLALIKQLSGETVQDYALTSQDGSTVKLSELFGDKDQLVLVHNMGKSCPYCTLWAEGFKSIYPYVSQRAAFVVVSPDEPSVQREFASERGWKFPMASSQGTTLFKDMGFTGEDGGPWPGVSTFLRAADGTITRHAFDAFGPGDHYCSVFGFLDLLPPVEGEEWFMPDLEGALKA